MKKNQSIPEAPVIPVLIYPDVPEAVAWLTEAFGFAERLRIGENHRSQLPHCARARAHGARIRMEPADFEYGERQYNAEDPFGHQWTFSETLADVAPREWRGELVSA